MNIHSHTHSHIHTQVADQAGSLVIGVLLFLKNKKGEAVLKKMVKKSKLDFMPVICPDMDEEAFTAFLTEKDLLCMVPVPDLSSDIGKMLSDGGDVAAVLAKVNESIAPELSAASLADVLADQLMLRVFKVGARTLLFFSTQRRCATHCYSRMTHARLSDVSLCVVPFVCIHHIQTI